jgi:ribosomal protein S18 acetylase RimI-like enzyme
MKNIEVKILTYDEMYETLNRAPDSSPTVVEPDIHYWRGLGHITYTKRHEHFFVVAVETLEGGGQKIVAVMEMQQASYYNANVVWLMSIGVAPTYRNRGIASAMCQKMCVFVKEKGLTLESSTMTELGEKYLKPALVRAVQASGTPVYFTQEHWYNKGNS